MKRITFRYAMLGAAVTLGSACSTAQQVTVADFEQGIVPGTVFVDMWEQSPFNDGRCTTAPEVVANPYADEHNHTALVLHHKRPYYAGDRNGVVIPLERPFTITPERQYVHVLVHKPLAGRVIVQGVDRDRDVTQFTGISEMSSAGEWCDAVIGVKGNNYLIDRLIVFPDAESAVGRLTGDIDVYIDNIVVNNDPTPRTAPAATTLTEGSVATAAEAPAAVKKERVRLTAHPSVEGAATFTLNPAPDADGLYKAGANVEITCVPAPGYRFVVWMKDGVPYGETMRANNPLPVTWLDEDLDLEMKVEKK